MKNITIRLSEEDLKAYETIKGEICAESPTGVIRWSLKKALASIEDRGFDNMGNGPIGSATISKTTEAQLPVVNLDDTEADEFPNWAFVRKGWDSEHGEEYMVIKMKVRPFTEKGIEEGDPEWGHFIKISKLT